METFRFKTNLKCGNCVAKVQAQLDDCKEIGRWSIDLKSPDRVLTVEADDKAAVASVRRILADAGFRSETV